MNSNKILLILIGLILLSGIVVLNNKIKKAKSQGYNIANSIFAIQTNEELISAIGEIQSTEVISQEYNQVAEEVRIILLTKGLISSKRIEVKSIMNKNGEWKHDIQY